MEIHSTMFLMFSSFLEDVFLSQENLAHFRLAVTNSTTTPSDCLDGEPFWMHPAPIQIGREPDRIARRLTSQIIVKAIFPTVRRDSHWQWASIIFARA
jgi:hypothetical protein